MGAIANNSRQAAVHQVLKARAVASDQPEQLTLFEDNKSHDISDEERIRRVIADLGQLRPQVRMGKSRYAVRVLWSLQVAFIAGLGPLRASHIGLLLRTYTKDQVQDPNVGKFFRNQDDHKEFIHLWSEDPAEFYSISLAGQAELARILG